MTKDSEFIKWWEDNKKDIYDKTLTTSWGCVHHFTQIAFQAGKQLMASQPAVEVDTKCSTDFHKEEYLNGSTFCRVCGKRIHTA